MGELKFRAWLPDYESMLYSDGHAEGAYKEYLEDENACGFFIDRDGVNVWVIEQRVSNIDHSESYILINQTNAIIMQWTGLSDCKNNEIYDGDIIKTHYPSTKDCGAYNEIGEVKIDRNLFRRTVIECSKHGINFMPNHESVVIGNVYKDKNLLGMFRK